MGKKKGKGRGTHDLDTMSEVSSVMSVSSYNTNRSDDEFDEHFVDDEGKFKSFIDDIGNKSAKKSGPALQFIKTKMQSFPMTSFLAGQKETLATELYRALRKAKGTTRSDILKCLSVLFVSLDEEDASCLIDDVQRELITALTGAGKGIAATLAIVTGCSFDPNDVLETTKTFRNIFKLGFAKGDGSIPELKTSQVALIVECLEGWSFVLASVAALPGFCRFVKEEIDCVISSLPSLFLQPSVELRIATGEALGIVYEVSRLHNGDDWNGFDEQQQIIEALDFLVQGVAVGGGSVKSTAKNERKAQRYSLKQVRDYIQDDIPPQNKVVNINKQDSPLEIGTFADLARYEMLCWCLESGVNSHLTFNELLRSDAWFGLGAVLPQLTPLDKPSGLDKLRTRVMRGHQDKVRANQRKKSRINAGDDHYAEYD